jgi:hypothetical protein
MQKQDKKLLQLALEAESLGWPESYAWLRRFPRPLTPNEIESLRQRMKEASKFNQEQFELLRKERWKKE